MSQQSQAAVSGPTFRQPVYLVDGLRTPFLAAGAAPGPFSAEDLAVHCGRALLLRQPFAPAAIEEVILGGAAPPEAAATPARVAALRLGLGDAVPAWSVQRHSASGMQAIASAAQAIGDGHRDIVLAGGAAAPSRTPQRVPESFAAWLRRYRGTRKPWRKARLLAQLRPRHVIPGRAPDRGEGDAPGGVRAGEAAEVLAHRFAISREAMDAYAVESHRRLGEARDAGHLAAEIAPAVDCSGQIYDSDDGLRRDLTIAELAKLRPAFEPPYGKVTAGNRAPRRDGAAWTLLASEAAVARHGLHPLARLWDAHWAGVAPAHMGLGPVHAATPLLQRHGLELNDLAGWEIDEASAAEVLACVHAWDDAAYCRAALGLAEPMGHLDRSRLNPHGGAISQGHPMDTSGTHIVLHLAQRLTRQGGGAGMAAVGSGGGQGGAMMIEAVGHG